MIGKIYFTENPTARAPAAPPAVEFDPFAGPKLLRLVPITESQAEIWAACLLGGEDASRAYNESVTLRLERPCSTAPRLQRALGVLCCSATKRLRSAFSADGKLQLRVSGAAHCAIDLPRR